jgi:hypothetical protein
MPMCSYALIGSSDAATLILPALFVNTRNRTSLIKVHIVRFSRWPYDAPVAETDLQSEEAGCKSAARRTAFNAGDPLLLKKIESLQLHGVHIKLTAR